MLNSEKKVIYDRPTRKIETRFKVRQDKFSSLPATFLWTQTPVLSHELKLDNLMGPSGSKIYVSKPNYFELDLTVALGRLNLSWEAYST